MNDTQKNMEFSCADCATHACKFETGFPKFCPTPELMAGEGAELIQRYDDEENHQIMITAANIEGEFYGRMCRVQETIEFAKRMGYKKIGLAFCIGLSKEANIMAKLLRDYGFEIESAICKIGSIEKVSVGIDKEMADRVGPKMCNPIMQAEYLNSRNTDMNIVIGLCVGHDMLFNKYVQAPTTTLVVKDRVLAHNPAGALYNLDGYYKKLKPKK